MKVGDLVVRLWHGKTKWDMIGLIVGKKFQVRSGSEAMWYYAIMWNVPQWPGATDKLGNWTAKEIRVISETG